MTRTIFFSLALFAALLLPAHAAAQTDPPRCCLQEETHSRDGEFVGVDCYVKTDPAQVCRPQSGGECIEVGRDFQCSKFERERDISCLDHMKCRDKVIQTIVNCPNLSSVDCENDQNRSSCFVYNNRCYSRVDGNVCLKITNSTDCAKSTRCRWQDNRCMSLLEAGLSSQYTPTEGSLLDPCAMRGTCRDVNDLLRLVLNYASRLFSLLGVIAFVMFVYGGITMVLSFGSPEKFKKGQMALVAAIIGIVISLSAYLLVNFILNSLNVTAEFRAL